MPRSRRPWSLISNHGAVVLVLSGRPDSSMREIAERVGVTERQVARIIHDLRGSGFVVVERAGRRNSYHLVAGRSVAHPGFDEIAIERFAGLVPDHGLGRDEPGLSPP